MYSKIILALVIDVYKYVALMSSEACLFVLSHYRDYCFKRLKPEYCEVL